AGGHDRDRRSARAARRRTAGRHRPRARRARDAPRAPAAARRARGQRPRRAARAWRLRAGGRLPDGPDRVRAAAGAARAHPAAAGPGGARRRVGARRGALGARPGTGARAPDAARRGGAGLALHRRERCARPGAAGGHRRAGHAAGVRRGRPRQRRARLQGGLAYGDLRATIQPSVVELEEQVLAFDPLVVDILDGRVTVTGRGDFADPAAADVRYAVVARGLAWTPAPEAGAAPDPAKTVRADADLGVAGSAAQWAVSGQARLSRGGEAAELDLAGTGTDARLDLDRLVAR